MSELAIFRALLVWGVVAATLCIVAARTGSRGPVSRFVGTYVCGALPIGTFIYALVYSFTV